MEHTTVAFGISKEELQEFHASGKVLITPLGDKYTVHKMSYGDYFLQPADFQGGEMDGFCKGTMWLQVNTSKINKYDYDYILDYVEE